MRKKTMISRVKFLSRTVNFPTGFHGSPFKEWFCFFFILAPLGIRVYEDKLYFQFLRSPYQSNYHFIVLDFWPLNTWFCVLFSINLSFNLVDFIRGDFYLLNYISKWCFLFLFNDQRFFLWFKLKSLNFIKNRIINGDLRA